MSNELFTSGQATGLTLYARLLSLTGQAARVDTEAFETPTAANWTHYAIPLTQIVGTGDYQADLPSWVPGGEYYAEAWQQLGLTPDPTDVLVGQTALPLRWSGASLLSPVTPSPPDAAGLTVLYFYLLDGDGQPVVGAVIRADLEQHSLTDAALITRQVTSATTDVDGYAELQLIQFASFTAGGVYRVTVPGWGERHVKVKTVADSINWVDLLALQ